MQNNNATSPIDTRLAWFAGNADALDLYERLVFIAHGWDDLVDRDKVVSHAAVNQLMANLLIYLPSNPIYRRYEGELRAMFMVSMASYMAANIMEKTRDAKKLEIAHYLRYAVVNAASFLIVALNGIDRAAEILSEAMPAMIPERVADYVKEHSHED